MGYTWGFSRLQAWCEPKKGCSHCKKAASITWGWVISGTWWCAWGRHREALCWAPGVLSPLTLQPCAKWTDGGWSSENRSRVTPKPERWAFWFVRFLPFFSPALSEFLKLQFIADLGLLKNRVKAPHLRRHGLNIKGRAPHWWYQRWRRKISFEGSRSPAAAIHVLVLSWGIEASVLNF